MTSLHTESLDHIPIFEQFFQLCIKHCMQQIVLGKAFPKLTKSECSLIRQVLREFYCSIFSKARETIDFNLLSVAAVKLILEVANQTKNPPEEQKKQEQSTIKTITESNNNNNNNTILADKTSHYQPIDTSLEQQCEYYEQQLEHKKALLQQKKAQLKQHLDQICDVPFTQQLVALDLCYIDYDNPSPILEYQQKQQQIQNEKNQQAHRQQMQNENHLPKRIWNVLQPSIQIQTDMDNAQNIAKNDLDLSCYSHIHPKRHKSDQNIENQISDNNLNNNNIIKPQLQPLPSSTKHFLQIPNSYINHAFNVQNQKNNVLLTENQWKSVFQLRHHIIRLNYVTQFLAFRAHGIFYQIHTDLQRVIAICSTIHLLTSPNTNIKGNMLNYLKNKTQQQHISNHHHQQQQQQPSLITYNKQQHHSHYQQQHQYIKNNNTTSEQDVQKH